MINKIYLVEIIDLDIKKKLEEEFVITNKIEEANILITRNIKVNKEFIDKAKLLKLVCIHGTGISEVDIEYCHQKGIRVFNTPYMNVEAVAEYAIKLLYDASRLTGYTLINKKVAILGYGHIGKRIHELLMPLGMDVVPFRRNDNLWAVLKDKDYIFLALSLNDTSYHIINQKSLGYIKKGAVLINIARGDLVDEDALINSLRDKTISWYLSDVFHNEPNINKELLKENVIASNHIASNMKDTLYDMGLSIYNGIKNYLSGNKIDNEL